jgi:hypothetical protein
MVRRVKRMQNGDKDKGSGSCRLQKLNSRREPTRRPWLCLAVASALLSGGGTLAEPAPAVAPPRPPAPEVRGPDEAALARTLVVATGISRSFALQIPQFMDQIGTHLARTRPELVADLNLVVSELKPEFTRQADEIVEIAAQIYAKHIPREDLQAAVTFFTSAAGRKYVEAQPAILTEVVTAMQGWQGKLSTDMMARVRAEMKKKGHEL